MNVAIFLELKSISPDSEERELYFPRKNVALTSFKLNSDKKNSKRTVI